MNLRIVYDASVDAKIDPRDPTPAPGEFTKEDLQETLSVLDWAGPDIYSEQLEKSVGYLWREFDCESGGGYHHQFYVWEQSLDQNESPLYPLVFLNKIIHLLEGEYETYVINHIINRNFKAYRVSVPARFVELTNRYKEELKGTKRKTLKQYFGNRTDPLCEKKMAELYMVYYNNGGSYIFPLHLKVPGDTYPVWMLRSAEELELLPLKHVLHVLDTET